MIAKLIDVISSLALIMQEETARLGERTSGKDLATLANAKLKLVSTLEKLAARAEREQIDWNTALDEEMRAKMVEALFALGEASAANAAILERHIDLSVEMISAIATEAKRLAGRATATYGAAGNLSLFDPAMPIAINSRY